MYHINHSLFLSLSLSHALVLSFSIPCQGAQESTGGQEGLVPPPFSAFPPPPPPQNGLATEFGGALYAAGPQGPAEPGAGSNGPASAPNNVSTPVSTNRL